MSRPRLGAQDPRPTGLGSEAPAGRAARGGDHRWATVLPTLCAVHCLVTPALIAVFPFLHFAERLEPVLYGFSLLLASWAVSSAWRRHRDGRVWLPVVGGALVWGASIAGAFQPVPESLTDIAGGLLLAGGIFWSGRLRHRTVCSPGCTCPAPH